MKYNLHKCNKMPDFLFSIGMSKLITREYNE